jgi:hypothetical protein
MRCDARDAMRGSMRCELVAMQCAALRCADCLRCNALRAGWLHLRGAGGAMLLTEGFLGWLSRFKGMGGWVGGGMGGWPVCECKTKGFIKTKSLGWMV